ncbi:Phosphoribosylglycinamide formyltransferase [subsurface metagenome]
MIRIAVLVSGGGTNLQALIDNCKSGFIQGKIVLVISSRPQAYALKRAEKENIHTKVIEKKHYGNEKEYSDAIQREIRAKKVDLICLAGFLVKLSPNIIKTYESRIMNIHPALLPSFGGKGMYGIKVHEEVLKRGQKYSGCSVHLVDEEYDHGPVILQKKVPVKKDDTPQILAERILKEEHKLYPQAVRMFALGKIKQISKRKS